MSNLLANAAIDRVSNAVAAGQTEIDCTGVDTQDADSVTFIVAIGAMTATGQLTVKLQQSSDNGVGDAWADLAGSGQVLGDTNSNKLVAIEGVQLQKRYVRLVLLRATANIAIDGVVSILRQLKRQPTQLTTALVNGGVVLQSPAAGTP